MEETISNKPNPSVSYTGARDVSEVVGLTTRKNIHASDLVAETLGPEKSHEQWLFVPVSCTKVIRYAFDPIIK
jgi:hypothetical protein